ncbi:MAG: ribonuclease E/G, partial [Acetatifactor sp.]|nr:ribonuclease E/G [Acetatifactor sp.]
SMERLTADIISPELQPLPPTGCIVRTKAAELIHETKFSDVADEAKAASATDEIKAANAADEAKAASATGGTRAVNAADSTIMAESGNGTALLGYFFELIEQYARLLHMARYRSCYTCLRDAPDAVEAVLQELAVRQEYQEIVTDSEKLYQMLSEYGNSHKDTRPLRMYQDNMLSLSKLYSIESKMETALESRVWLKSGGYLIIEPTEALTVIDVNTGKYEARKSNEEAILTVNLEAAREVALQLRLRNLSGIIIVDFINMTHNNSKSQVMNLLKQLVGKDRIKTTIVDMTPLGLVEITRKKTSKPLREQMRQQ